MFTKINKKSLTAFSGVCAIYFLLVNEARASQTATPPYHNVLASKIDSSLRKGILHKTKTAVFVQNANTGEIVYAHKENEGLNPASNVKLISTATALEILKPDWRYQTAVYGPAPQDGTIAGDLYLLGSADPTLSPSGLRDIVEQLQHKGVRHIDGNIVVGKNALRDALAIPKVSITVSAGKKVGHPVQVTTNPASDFFVVQIDAKTKRRGRSSIRVRTSSITDAHNRPRMQIHISGTLRTRRQRTFRRYVHHRDWYTPHLLRQLLMEAQISVAGTIRRTPFARYVWKATLPWHRPTTQILLAPALAITASLRSLGMNSATTNAMGQRDVLPPYVPVLLASHHSKPIGTLINRINKHSNNFLADRVAISAGIAVYGGVPTMDKAINAMRAWLARDPHVPMSDIVLDTGSGLSYKTRLSARTIVRVLRRASGYLPSPLQAPTAQAFQRSLSVAGVDGTLRNRFGRSAVEGKLLAKTGTLTGIIALAGILSLDPNNALCFALVTNQSARRHRRKIRQAHETLVQYMYQYLQAIQQPQSHRSPREQTSEGSKPPLSPAPEGPG